MILSDGTSTRDKDNFGPGKFEGESGMTLYLYNAMMNGDNGDEDFSNGEGNGDWANRYGRRVLRGDSNGFVGLLTFPTEAEAEAWMAESAPEDEDEPDGDSRDRITDTVDRLAEDGRQF